MKEIRAEKRDKKKKPKMPVSGRSVFKIRGIIEEKAKQKIRRNKK